MAKKKAKAVPVKELLAQEGGDLLNGLVSTFKPKDEASKDHARDLVGTLVKELLDPGMVRDKRVTKTINARIAAIDELLSRQVDEIIHAGNTKARKRAQETMAMVREKMKIG